MRLRSALPAAIPARRAQPAPAARPDERRRAVALPTEQQRARAAGGPADRQTQTCGCGTVFEASVVTDVACPVCGAQQAW